MPADGLTAGEDDSDAAGRDLDRAIGAAADALGRIATEAGPTEDVGDVAADAGMPAGDHARSSRPRPTLRRRAATLPVELPPLKAAGLGLIAGSTRVARPPTTRRLSRGRVDRGPDDLDGGGSAGLGFTGPRMGRDSSPPWCADRGRHRDGREHTRDQTTADGTVPARQGGREHGSRERSGHERGGRGQRGRPPDAPGARRTRPPRTALLMTRPPGPRPPGPRLLGPRRGRAPPRAASTAAEPRRPGARRTRPPPPQAATVGEHTRDDIEISVTHHATAACWCTQQHP